MVSSKIKKDAKNSLRLRRCSDLPLDSVSVPAESFSMKDLEYIKLANTSKDCFVDNYPGPPRPRPFVWLKHLPCLPKDRGSGNDYYVVSLVG